MSALVSLDDITVCTAAGITGRGFAQVRHLDRLSLTINESEFVIIRSKEPRERHTLLRMIAGDPRVTRLAHGQRHTTQPLVIRSGFVPGDILPHLAQEWYSAARFTSPQPRRHREAWLYLLRATPTSSADADPTRWLVWLRQLLLRQGSVVVTTDTSSVPSTVRDHQATMVREPSPTATGSSCECRSRPHIRLLQLGRGRIAGDVRLPECARCRHPASPRSANGS